MKRSSAAAARLAVVALLSSAQRVLELASARVPGLHAVAEALVEVVGRVLGGGRAAATATASHQSTERARHAFMHGMDVKNGL